MNRISITGYKMLGLTNLLRAKMTQHEGVNLDVNKFSLIKAEDDCVHLLGMVEQPSYHAFMNQNISGCDKPLCADGESGEETKDSLPTACTPIDKDAVAGSAEETYAVCSSAMRKLLRIIGWEKGVFEATEGGVSIDVDGALYRLDAEQSAEGIGVPQFALGESDADDALLPFAVLENTPFGEMLDSVIGLSNMARTGGSLRGRTMHVVFVMKDEKVILRLESMSDMANMLTERECPSEYLDTDFIKGMGGELHFAIQQPAAECLYEEIKAQGKPVYLASDDTLENLYGWCGCYSIRIFTEDVNLCSIADYGDFGQGIDLAAGPLLEMLMKVKRTGGRTVDLTMLRTGLMKVKAPQGKYSDDMPGTVYGEPAESMCITLPLDTFINVIKGFGKSMVSISIDESHSYIFLSNVGGDVRAIVQKL